MSCHDLFSHSEMLANKIDGASDAAQAVASATLVTKVDNIPQPTPWADMVKENNRLAKQNQALAIIIQEMKSREDRTTYWYKELEKTRDALYSDIRRQRNRIKDLEARLANNQAKLSSELQDTITTLEEAVDVASWTEMRQNQEICCLEEMVDSKNISEMEESLARFKERNFVLCKENLHLNLSVVTGDYNIKSIICRPAVQEWKASWTILHPRKRYLVLLVRGGRQREGKTICPTTICHFSLVLMRMGVIFCRNSVCFVDSQ